MDPKKPDDALATMMAMAHSIEETHVGRIAKSMPSLVRRLQKFYFPAFASSVSGLLTIPENQPAWFRLEILLHLGAAFCNGKEVPTTAQIRDIINNVITKSALTRLEDPVEDVFVSNVGTSGGNVRLINGGWPGNDYFLQSCLAALVMLKSSSSWATDAIRSVSALLKIADVVADRAGLKRYMRLETRPRQPLKITTAVLDESASNVMFARKQLEENGISARLEPFILSGTEATAIADEVVGSSVFDRKPLLATSDRVIFALPTAASAAARQYILAQAAAAGELKKFSDALSAYQYQEIKHVGRVGWGIGLVDVQSLGISLGQYEFVGRFDDGAYVHIIYIPGDLDSVLQDGLVNGGTSALEFSNVVMDRARQLAKLPDYRRGMTMMLAGGVGGGFGAGIDALPEDWKFLGINAPEFMMLAWDHELTALRAWKLLEQRDQLEKRGIAVSNLNGFINLYAWATHFDFSLVPPNVTTGILGLQTDFMTPLLTRLRQSLDAHFAPMPDRPAYVDVQRNSVAPYFKAAESLPMYVSPSMAAGGLVAGCTETGNRVWWIELARAQEGGAERFQVQMWEMALNWLTKLAPLLEEALPNLRKGAVSIKLSLAGISADDLRLPEAPVEPVRPDIEVRDGVGYITCTAEYLQTFCDARNVGDRMMAASLVELAFALAGELADPELVENLVREVIPNDMARFVHFRPTKRVQEMVFAYASLPSMRLIAQEDRAWAELGLAKEAGWAGTPGELPDEIASQLLHKAVAAIWRRIRELLKTCNRESVISKALSNFSAIERDRAQWRTTAAALLALYDDQQEVIASAADREARRSLAGLASRVLAEMAVCECPAEGGRTLSNLEFDRLTAEISLLVDCAAHSDSLHFGLSEKPQSVFANGSFGFDHTFALTLQNPYMAEHSRRGFVSAAAGYAEGYSVSSGSSGGVDPKFDLAIREELGITMAGFARFCGRVFDIAHSQGTAHVRMRRSELVHLLHEEGATEPMAAYRSLSLRPRKRWDEERPENADKRDWYPWRFNRRLSVTRRPLVELTGGDDPLVFVSPILLERTALFLMEAAEGSLPVELFDSPDLKSLIGSAVDREGHAFNHSVAESFRGLGYEALAEVSATQLGGPAALGDYDVITWRRNGNVVNIVECKRLAFARTIGEVGERLKEFTTLAAPGEERTPIQRHLDRMDYIRTAKSALERLTGIHSDSLIVRSVVVTDVLVPMQFSKRALAMVDVVADTSQLAAQFSLGG